MTYRPEYKLVIHSNTEDLTKEVNDLLWVHWKCLNGIVIHVNPEIKNGFWYIQTMIKE